MKLYFTSWKLTCFITGSLCLLTIFTHFTHPLSQAVTNLFSVSMSWLFYVLCARVCVCVIAVLFLIPYISEIIWFLSFSDRLISLSITPSGLIHVVTSGNISWFVCLFVFD